MKSSYSVNISVKALMLHAVTCLQSSAFVGNHTVEFGANYVWVIRLLAVSLLTTFRNMQASTVDMQTVASY